MSQTKKPAQKQTVKVTQGKSPLKTKPQVKPNAVKDSAKAEVKSVKPVAQEKAAVARQQTQAQSIPERKIPSATPTRRSRFEALTKMLSEEEE